MFLGILQWKNAIFCNFDNILHKAIKICGILVKNAKKMRTNAKKLGKIGGIE